MNWIRHASSRASLDTTTGLESAHRQRASAAAWCAYPERMSIFPCGDGSGQLERRRLLLLPRLVINLGTRVRCTTVCLISIASSDTRLL